MGKSVPRGVKSRAHILMERFPKKFSTNFESNKLFIEGLKLPLTKTVRNWMAGYVTRKVHAKAAN